MNGWQIMFLIAAALIAWVGLIRLTTAPINRAEVARYFLAALIAMLFVALTACSTPAIKDRIVEVAKPVAVQPIAAKDVPNVPAPLGPRPKLANGKTDVRRAGDLLLSKVCEFVGYAIKADPLLRVSAGLPPQEVPKFPECER